MRMFIFFHLALALKYIIAFTSLCKIFTYSSAPISMFGGPGGSGCDGVRFPSQACQYGPVFRRWILAFTHSLVLKQHDIFCLILLM